MEPTESAAPDSRLRRRSGAWRWGSRRPTGVAPVERSRVWGGSREPGGIRRVARTSGLAGVDGRGPARGNAPGVMPLTAAPGSGALGAGQGPGTSGPDSERHLSWPALPAAVVATAGFVLGAGFYRAFTWNHALFPSGTVGWSLAVLTGVIVGHLVALGRARWWGGTGSGAALTLAVLLLYGWVPAGMVSLTVVVLVGIARRDRWRGACCTARSTSSASARVRWCWPRSGACRPSRRPGTPRAGPSTPCPSWRWSRSPISR